MSSAKPSSLSARLAHKLARRREQHLYRERRILGSPQGVEVQIEGECLLSFCSNDYLGLANHPAVVNAFKAAADRFGVGAGASHLITGHSLPHHALEEELADFVGTPRALLFSTGYMANLGVVAALLGRHAEVYEDKLNHASLIDAGRQNASAVRRYAHGDIDRLRTLMAQSQAGAGSKMILSDGVFSMDGDLAPLPALLALARAHDAYCLIDDAHGLGVLGANGGGSFAHWGIAPDEPAILMGTLGKALGTFGAFVASTEAIVETLIQEARTYVYTTALPPAVAEATRASLRLARMESWRRERLADNIGIFRRGAAKLGLHLLDSLTPIQPVVLGTPEAALAASEHLRRHGILVPAIRPPTVPAHSARLRVTFSSTHTAAHVMRLLDALSSLPEGNA